MPTIKNAAYYNSAGAVVIDGNIHQGISNFQLIPDTPSEQHVDIGGDVQTVTGTPTWRCEFDFPQDFVTAGSLSLKSIDWAGLLKQISYVPGDGAVGFTVGVIFQPATIGGAARSIPTAKLSLPVVGQPIQVPAG